MSLQVGRGAFHHKVLGVPLFKDCALVLDLEFLSVEASCLQIFIIWMTQIPFFCSFRFVLGSLVFRTSPLHSLCDAFPSRVGGRLSWAQSHQSPKFHTTLWRVAVSRRSARFRAGGFWRLRLPAQELRADGLRLART